ncbi:MAG: ABC-type transport auxiliary lipoprotein family protein [Syntrophorhabdaceae bacterium]|nr:ABC-type transport auxiliary lipoprotein family protein [Syntrophorhabdaceae bacterium]
MKNIRSIIIFLLTLLLSGLTSGCINLSKPPQRIDNYYLEYEPPIAKTGIALNTSLKFERFSAMRIYNTPAMLYRKGSYRYTAYNYSRWRVVPSDMVSDFLLRDIRESRILKAVYPYHNPEGARFHIQGSIDEFLEIIDNEDGSSIASLSLTITLLDTESREITTRVVLQKTYSYKEKIKANSPFEFSRGMSLNMGNISREIIVDIYGAIKKRLDG